MFRQSPNRKWHVRQRQLTAEFQAEGLAPDAAKRRAWEKVQLEKAAQKERNREAKAAKLAKAMTCQCCARPIFAETGLIAHHGYTRPWEGVQTSSCWGARELPFEVDREVLGRLISWLERMEASTLAALENIRNETVALTLAWQVREAGRARAVDKRADVTRETWADVVAANPLALQHRPGYKFDNLKDAEIRSTETNLRMIRGDLKMQRERFADWKQTHVKRTEVGGTFISWDKIGGGNV